MPPLTPSPSLSPLPCHPHSHSSPLLSVPFPSSGDRHRRIYSLFLGYLLLLALRTWGSSFNPIFFHKSTNFVAMVAGVLLAAFLYWNDWRTPAVEGSEGSVEEEGRLPGLASTAVAFGAALFLLQHLYGDISVVSRYSVAPYPDRGPYPYPWG